MEETIQQEKTTVSEPESTVEEPQQTIEKPTLVRLARRIVDLEDAIVEIQDTIAQLKLRIARINGRFGGRPANQDVQETNVTTQMIPAVWQNDKIWLDSTGRIHEKGAKNGNN